MSTPTKYRKKPVVVEAMHFNGTNASEIAAWTDDLFRELDDRAHHDGIVAEVWDELHSTWVGVKRGQWVIRGVKGEYYPIDEDVLDETYIVEEEPVPGSLTAALYVIRDHASQHAMPYQCDEDAVCSCCATTRDNSRMLGALECIAALVAPQWRSVDYDRNALVDDIRVALGALTEAAKEAE